MLVVPIIGDKVKTHDGGEHEVVGYNNYKTKGPAVFADGGFRKPPLTIYFFDIDRINGVRVTFQNGSKVLDAHGILKRKYQLPQINDTIIVASGDPMDDEGGKVLVKNLKLHNKQAGLSRGLLVLGDDDILYGLKEIIDIKRREGGTSLFDMKKFQRLYSEYTGQ